MTTALNRPATIDPTAAEPVPSVEPRPVLSVSEAAELLGVSERLVLRQIRLAPCSPGAAAGASS